MAQQVGFAHFRTITGYSKAVFIIAVTHKWKYYFGINNLFSLIRKNLLVFTTKFVPTQTLQVQRSFRYNLELSPGTRQMQAESPKPKANTATSCKLHASSKYKYSQKLKANTATSFTLQAASLKLRKYC